MSEPTVGYAVLPLNSLVSTSFSIRSSEDLELDDLTESIRAYGVLEPIVVRASSKETGMFEIVMGERRVRAARKAGLREIPAIVKELSDEDAAVLQLIENLQRKDLTDEEMAASLAFLAKLTTWPPKIIAERLKRSYTWVMLHLPSDFKDEEMAELGRKGGEARATALQDAATKIVAMETELAEAERKARSQLTQCQNPACLRMVPQDQLMYRNGKPYCRKCAPFIKEIKPVEKEEKPVSAASLDSAEQRKARMQPGKSLFEERVVFRFNKWLSEQGLHGDSNREFCVLSTKPDDYVEEIDGLVYVDGPPHLKAKQADKDERLRELLQKHHEELNIKGFPFKADTKQEEDRVFSEMCKWVEGLKEELGKWKTKEEIVTMPGASDDREAE